MRHKHADLIIAWANGADIQISVDLGGGLCRWVDEPYPTWKPCLFYRINPTPKPDVTLYYSYDFVVVSMRTAGRPEHMHKPGSDALSLAFDGETGKLKNARVL